MLNSQSKICWRLIVALLFAIQNEVDSIPCDADNLPGCTDCTDILNAGDMDCICIDATQVADCVVCQSEPAPPATPNCLDCSLDGNDVNPACIAYCDTNPTDAVCPQDTPTPPPSSSSTTSTTSTTSTPNRKRVRISNLSFQVRRRIRRNNNRG